MFLVGFLQFWWWLVDVGLDRFEEVFEHEGGELSCRCALEGGYTGSQVVAYDGVDIEHSELEALVDGCHVHCVGWVTQVMAMEAEVMKAEMFEAPVVVEFCEDK